MHFSSSTFLFLFLPLVFLVYFFTKKKYKNIVLLIASLAFYTSGEKFLVIVMITSTIIDYKCGHLIESGKQKLGLYLSLITNLGVLFFFKYFNFGIDNLISILNNFSIDTSAFKVIPKIVLPMGISFYVFKTMYYSIDVYYGKIKASRNFINFATYVTFFPQLVADPIVRYQDIQSYLTNRTITNKDVSIGLGRVFGFKILENFNYPYIYKSIQDFWRRWHISLSSWLKDYLYIHLGGNRKGNARTYVNLIIVFFILF